MTLKFSIVFPLLVIAASACWQSSEQKEEDASTENDVQKDSSVDLDADTDGDADADSDNDADADADTEWHTFYGSAVGDEGNSIALDSSGNIFIAGTSEGTWNGPADQIPLNGYNNGRDIIIIKNTSDGTYENHTFYGSENTDYVCTIAVDKNSDTIIAGTSALTWDGPEGQVPLNPFNESWFDFVILKLNNSGIYKWHTFYGSAVSDSCNDMIIDSNNNIYVVGEGSLWDGPMGQEPIHEYSGRMDDIVIFKLDSNGAYIWHTFFGGPDSGGDIANGITLDNSQNIYVVGSSDDTWNGPDDQTPINDHTGIFSDIVVLKLDEDGFYQWHTFYPANQDLSNYGITSDSNGNIYATWNSDDAWDGPAGQRPLHPHSGGATDIVILKLDSNGEYQWHTFYGSGFRDYANALTLDRSGNILVTGNSVDFWNGPEGLLPFNAPSSYENLFVLSVDPEGNYLWHSFYGGDGVDRGRDIVTDNDDNIFVAGSSDESWNWPDGGAPLHSFSGGNDAVILKLKAVPAE